MYIMAMKFIGIEWDKGNLEKCQKHGVSIPEIEAVLLSKSTTVLPDVKHSYAEERFWGIGKTSAGRSVFLTFTLRYSPQGVCARAISARYMHRKEVEHYEKGS